MLKYIPKVEFRAVIISMVVGISLMAVKFVAYLLTGSDAIFSDAVESIANVLASGMAFYALYTAHSPADEDHPYGHGKVEFISAAFEGAMIMLAAFFIFGRTLETLWTGRFLEEEKLDWGLLLVGFAMVVNGLVGLYLLYTGRKQRSMTLEADGKHLMSDVYTSAAVLVALGLVKLTGWKLLDPLMALCMGCYIAWMSFGLLRRAVAGLMDKQDQTDETRVSNILNSHLVPNGLPPLICAWHKLRHRHTGRYMWVDLHLVVPANLTVKQAHDLATNIEEEIETKLGEDGNATAHVEPCNGLKCPRCKS